MRLTGKTTRWLALVGLLTILATPALRAVDTELVPVTATSTPFFAAIDLDTHHYTEDEYLVSGVGNVYEYEASGDVRIQTAGVPYRTRILIRRPAPQAFNGVVLFELLNPTAGHDLDFEWHFNRELLVAEGYVWVGLTMKDTTVAFLQGWDPSRYADLAMPDRGLAYDMFAQVAALLRDPGDAENPLKDYGVEIVIGTGYSQSADYLTTFSNEFHETARTADGRHAFDGYLHGGGNGAARRINSSDPELYLDERRFNRVAAPLIRVQSETELAIFSFSSAGTRQPDSDVFRTYEIAGGSHADEEALLRTGEVIARDLGFPVLPPCGEPLSPLAIGPIHRSSLSNLVRWIRTGEAPPPSQLLELDSLGQVQRDSYGNVLGGIRVPTFDVPLGTFEPGNLGPLPCPLAGAYFAFDDATLASLYPSHGRYVSRVVRSALTSMRAGYLLPRDAVRYILEAAQSDVGR